MDLNAIREVVQTAGAGIALFAAAVGGVILLLRYRAETHRVRAQLTFDEWATDPDETGPGYGELVATAYNAGREAQIVEALLFMGGSGQYLGSDGEIPKWLKRGERLRLKMGYEKFERETSLATARFERRDLSDADRLNCYVQFRCGDGDVHRRGVENKGDLKRYLARRPRASRR